MRVSGPHLSVNYDSRRPRDFERLSEAPRGQRSRLPGAHDTAAASSRVSRETRKHRRAGPRAGPVGAALAMGFDRHHHTPAAVARTCCLSTFLPVQSGQPGTDRMFPDSLADAAGQPGSAVATVCLTLPVGSRHICSQSGSQKASGNETDLCQFSLLSQRTFSTHRSPLRLHRAGHPSPGSKGSQRRVPQRDARPPGVRPAAAAGEGWVQG